ARVPGRLDLHKFSPDAPVQEPATSDLSSHSLFSSPLGIILRQYFAKTYPSTESWYFRRLTVDRLDLGIPLLLRQLGRKCRCLSTATKLREHQLDRFSRWRFRISDPVPAHVGVSAISQ